MTMEISSAYSSYAGIYTNVTDSKPDYLAELQKRNPKLNIQSGYANKSMGSGSYPEKIDVTIAPNILAEMAANPDTAAKWEKALTGIPAAAQWAASTINAMTGGQLLYIHYWVDENGNMGACSASGPSPDEVGNMISERKKQQEEQLEARLEASREKHKELEKLEEKQTEKKEQERQLAMHRKRRRTEGKNLQMREAKIAGNNVRSLTEKLAAIDTHVKGSTVLETVGVDIKV